MKRKNELYSVAKFFGEGLVVTCFSAKGFAGRAEQKLGEEIRKQGGQGTGRSMIDLVFDETTGEFRQVAKGETPEQGTVVTGMTKEGFAC